MSSKTYGSGIIVKHALLGGGDKFPLLVHATGRIDNGHFHGLPPPIGPKELRINHGSMGYNR